MIRDRIHCILFADCKPHAMSDLVNQLAKEGFPRATVYNVLRKLRRKDPYTIFSNYKTGFWWLKFAAFDPDLKDPDPYDPLGIAERAEPEANGESQNN